MHPIDHYETLRRGREELLKQAEYERMARRAMVKQAMNLKVHRKVAHWLGSRLGGWGEKLEQTGTFRQANHLPSTPSRTE